MEKSGLADALLFWDHTDLTTQSKCYFDDPKASRTAGFTNFETGAGSCSNALRM
jgi:hypothetical protein